MRSLRSESRVVGFDDSSFSFSDELVHLFGVVARANGYVDGIMHDLAHVDGTDATRVLSGMILRSRFRKQLRLIFTDGIAVGGFNVIDIRELNEITGIPVIAVTRNQPDMDAMKKALRSHFDDWSDRYDIISRGILHSYDLDEPGLKPIYLKSWGLDDDGDPDLVGSMVRAAVVRGAYPEPLRLAHLMATALVNGESHGRA